MGLGKKAVLKFTTLEARKVPEATCPRWAVLGRSNVGKSSLLNALTHPQKFFRTGAKPGVTIGLVGVEVYLSQSEKSRIELVDLPGFGYARHSDNVLSGWEDLIVALRERSEARGLLWVWLADPKRAPAEEEFQLLHWLKSAPFMFVFTKSDQVNTKARVSCEKTWQYFIEAASEGPYWVSAMRGEGFDALSKSARSFVRLSVEMWEKNKNEVE
jgi:GTP-binding protein